LLDQLIPQVDEHSEAALALPGYPFHTGIVVKGACYA
jgi:hypothetical protein